MDNNTLYQKADLIAIGLGWQWTVHQFPADDRPSHYVQLDGPDGIGLHLAVRKGRLEISGQSRQYHEFHVNSRLDLGKITVSPDKMGHQISKDIQRRLLPVYKETWAELKELAESAQAARDSMDRFAQVLTEEFPAITVQKGWSDSKDHLTIWGPGGLRGSLNSYGSPKLEIRAESQDVVLRVLRALYPEGSQDE